LLLMLAGWINRHQQAVIAYQREETKVPREMFGGKRLRFTDGQRRRLALKAKAAKYDSSGQRRPGRPSKTGAYSRPGGASCQGKHQLGGTPDSGI
jgi:hypothetical protein